VCFDDATTNEIHISYHNYEHYSSVRRLGDHTSNSAHIRQSMIKCDQSTKKKTSSNQDEKDKSRSTASKFDAFDEHDIDYIASQLTNPVDRELIRETLFDHDGDIDQALMCLLTLALSQPANDNSLQNDSIERIMLATSIDNVDRVEQSLTNNQNNIDSTVNDLLKTTLPENVHQDVNEKKDDTCEIEQSQNQSRTLSTRETKCQKKKAKKQRAMEKHRSKIIAQCSEKNVSKSLSENIDTPVVNDNEQLSLTQLEFIRI
jgi:NACalpha-BTF3-like transcription factor